MLFAPLRRELLVHCYRMLGSVHDAEDVVQETYLRAWRSFGDFEGRSKLRHWLYRIATNAALRELEKSHRRSLPSGLGNPVEEPTDDHTLERRDIPWLEPIPTALLHATSEPPNPADVVQQRQSIRLAFVADLSLRRRRHVAVRHRRTTRLPFVQHFSICRRGNAPCCCCATCWRFERRRSQDCSTSAPRRPTVCCSVPGTNWQKPHHPSKQSATRSNPINSMLWMNTWPRSSVPTLRACRHHRLLEVTDSHRARPVPSGRHLGQRPARCRYVFAARRRFLSC